MALKNGEQNLAIEMKAAEADKIILDEVQQKPLAETGHSIRTLVWCEYGLQVDNEAAHGVIADTNNLLA